MSKGGSDLSDLPPRKETILADLVRLEALSRELAEECRAALERRGAGDALSEKAAESIRLVERLAGYASGEDSLEEYRQATQRLEGLIREVDTARDPAELAALQQRALESVNAWAGAVERVLEGVLSRARP